MGAAPRALLAAVAAAHGVHARNADPKAGYCYCLFIVGRAVSRSRVDGLWRAL